MPLNITSWISSIKACGFGGQGLARITTGSVQSISASPRSGTISLADGNIVTGSNIHSNNGQTLFYRTLTIANYVPSYGAIQTASQSFCGAATINLPLNAGEIASGRQITHAEDGTNSYSNNGTILYKSFSIPGAIISFGAQQESPTVQSGSQTDIPSTGVTDSTTVNICTGWRYDGGGGACGRLSYSSINHRLFYRTLTIQ